jgi:hypothetical protein
VLSRSAIVVRHLDTGRSPRHGGVDSRVDLKQESEQQVNRCEEFKNEKGLTKPMAFRHASRGEPAGRGWANHVHRRLQPAGWIATEMASLR